MPHIHTNPGQHDLTASAYIIVELPGQEPRMWFHRHKKLNQWMQFGGHVELHEHPWSAVLHELREESGYQPSQLQVLQPQKFLRPLTGAVLHPADVCINTHHFPDLDHYHTDIAYAFVTDQRPSQKPTEGESARLQAMTRSELLALPAEQIPASTREIALYIFDTITPNWTKMPTSLFFLSSYGA